MDFKVRISNIFLVITFILCLFQNTLDKVFFDKIDILTTIILLINLFIIAEDKCSYFVLITATVLSFLSWTHLDNEYFYHFANISDVLILFGIFINTYSKLALALLLKVMFNLFLGFSKNYYYNPTELFDILFIIIAVFTYHTYILKLFKQK